MEKKSKNPIRIINYPWHLAHQHALMKIPNTKWDWLVQHRRNYAEGPRGDMITKFGIKWVPHYEKGKYDFALLHLDQQCLEENLWDRGKGSLYRDVDSVIKDIPKIVIMHGTPFYPEMFSQDITEENYKQLGFEECQIGMSSELIDRLMVITKDADAIVFNSHRAKEQWVGTKNKREVSEGSKETIFQTIWHGMDEKDWFNLPKEPRVVTMISPAGLDKYYDRTFMGAVKEMLRERDIGMCQITVDASFRNWDEYRNFLGRSLIYINLTKESPMPRARTEAMFSGCCVVTTPWQDADKYIEHGVNGYILNKRNPETVARFVEELVNDYKKTKSIGEAGRQTALKIFSGERYRQEWIELITKVIKK